jgi:cytochrome c-type biogenesis protein CcmH/NrfG
MTDTKKQQQPYLTFIIIFIIGFISGVGFAAFKLGTGESSAPATAVTQQTDDKTAETATAIANLEAEVTAEPEDFASWVRLGHLYFDTGQHEKAIAAYTTSLKYHSGDANLLTDLGVMYRETKQPQKAIEMFEKAQAMDSQHQPSRFNEGIVRLYDLNDTKGAIAAWEELLTINPEAKAGDGRKMREFIDQLKSGQSSN